MKEDTFYLVQRGLENRFKTGGRVGVTTGESVLNIWNGILVDHAGRTVVQTTTGLRRRSLVVGEHLRGFKGGKEVFFPADAFDWALVYRLYNHRMTSAPNAAREWADQLTAAEQALKDTADAVETIQNNVANLEVKFDFVFDTLSRLEEKRNDLHKQVEAAKIKAAGRTLNYKLLLGDWSVTLAGLKAGTLSNERRLELREAIRGMVKSVRVAWSRDGYQNFNCACVITDHDGEESVLQFRLIGKQEKLMKGGRFGGWGPTRFNVEFVATDDAQAFDKVLDLDAEERADVKNLLGVDVDQIVLADVRPQPVRQTPRTAQDQRKDKVGSGRS